MLGCLRVVGLGSKPGEADRDAAADGVARAEAGLLAEKQDFFRVRGLPGGELGAVEVDFGCGLGGGDANLRQVAFSRDDDGDRRDFEVSVVVGHRFPLKTKG